MNNKWTKTINVVLISALLPVTSMAGGLWLNELGDPSQGRAGAGASAGTGDAANSVHNPRPRRALMVIN